MVYTNYQSQRESSGFFLPPTLGCVSVCSRPFLVPGLCSGQIQHAYYIPALLGTSALRSTPECCWTSGPLWHRSCCLGKWWDVANGPQIFAAAAARAHCLLSLWMFRRLYFQFQDEDLKYLDGQWLSSMLCQWVGQRSFALALLRRHHLFLCLILAWFDQYLHLQCFCYLWASQLKEQKNL